MDSWSSVWSESVRPWGDGTRVVVAEEDAGLRAHLVERLEASGYRVSEVRSGAELSRLVVEPVLGRGGEPPDLLVVGARLGAISGLKIVALLRRVAPHLPVVVVTEAGDTRSFGVAQRLGASAVLSKPLAPVRLLDAVRRFMAP